MSYRDLITSKIKDAVNEWLEKLKLEKPTLHLTRQWKVIYSKDGFTPGHVSLPVVTGAKKGKHLIAEVGFVVPDNLEIELDEIELSLRDEPFKIKPEPVSIAPVSEPLGLLNDIIVGINSFLSELSLGPLHTSSKPMPTLVTPNKSGFGLKINHPVVPQHDVNEIRERIRSSHELPVWLRAIGNKEIYGALIDKITEAYVQYVNKQGKKVSLVEFFKMYEEYLKREGKLYDYCRYKAQPVELEDGLCQEGYCSKKPFNTSCEQVVLKFGKK